MKKLSKHKIQAISLMVAVLLLWYSFGLDHKTAMIISSVIIAINVFMEFGG